MARQASTTRIDHRNLCSRSPAWTLVAAAIILLPAILFVWVRLTTPGDGTEIVLDLVNRDKMGLTILPHGATTDALQPGDTVIAIGGRSVEDWLRDAFSGIARIYGSRDHSLWYDIRRDGRLEQMEIALSSFPLRRVLLHRWSIFLFVTYLQVISVFVFVRRPYLGGARLFLILSTLNFSNAVVFNLGLQASDLTRGWLVVLWLGQSVALDAFVAAVFLHLALVFPRRHPLLERYPSLLLWCYVGVWAIIVICLTVHWSQASTMASRLMLLVQSTTFFNITYFMLILCTWLTSYHTSINSVDRNQIKWILWGMFVALVPYIAFSLLPPLLGMDIPLGANFSVVGIFLCAIPTVATIAILRESLFDIDVLISQTVVYVSLTSILAGIYAACMSIMQRLFAPGDAPQAAIVPTTLLLTTMLTPIRNGLQAFVDSRFKQKSDPLKRINSFERATQEMVDSLNITQITRRLLDESLATLRVDEGAVFLNSRAGWQRIYSSQNWHEEGVFSVPIKTDNTIWGMLALGRRPNGRSYTVDESRALNHAANRIGELAGVMCYVGVHRSDTDFLGLQLGQRPIDFSLLPAKVPANGC